VASKVLTYRQRMIYFLEPGVSQSAALDNIEDFRRLRSSAETWNVFKQETTPAEFAAMELIWEFYEAYLEVRNGNTDKLRAFSETLKIDIAFEGLDTKDVSWEMIHTTVLTVQVPSSQNKSEIRFANTSKFHSLVLGLKRTRSIWK
jgi:hypothetical protein